MLRITVQQDPRVVTIKLEGKIVGLWTDEFDRAWRSVAQSLGPRKLCVDLRGVTFIDSHGRELLREIYQATGATFLADSPLTRYFIEEASHSRISENWRPRSLTCADPTDLN